MADDDPELEAVIADLGHRVVGETWLRETSGVDLDLVAALEAALTPIDDGLRLGAPAAAADAPDPDGFEVVTLPADLLAAASGIDRGAAVDALAERAVAFETAEGGTKPGGRAAVVDPTAVDEIVAALSDVLRAKYGSVTREGDRIVATRRTFDPAAAAEAGVPEGPAFGRLSAGDSVEVDGRTVTPEEVHTEETVSFRVS